jgi:hypothetical protein
MVDPFFHARACVMPCCVSPATVYAVCACLRMSCADVICISVRVYASIFMDLNVITSVLPSVNRPHVFMCLPTAWAKSSTSFHGHVSHNLYTKSQKSCAMPFLVHLLVSNMVQIRHWLDSGPVSLKVGFHWRFHFKWGEKQISIYVFDAFEDMVLSVQSSLDSREEQLMNPFQFWIELLKHLETKPKQSAYHWSRTETNQTCWTVWTTSTV